MSATRRNPGVPADPLRGRDMLCFSHDWNGDPLSKTHLMRLLARDNRVLWAVLARGVLAVGWMSRGQPVNLHLNSAKAAACAGYVFGLLLLFTGTYSRVFFGAALALASFAAIEALLVIVTGRAERHGSLERSEASIQEFGLALPVDRRLHCPQLLPRQASMLQAKLPAQSSLNVAKRHPGLALAKALG